MTDTRTAFERFVEKRKIGLSAVVLFFVAQLLYSQYSCSAGAMAFLEDNAYAMLPGLLIFIMWQTNSGLSTYCAVLGFFCLDAVTSECGPYIGGGASMAYVGVFLVGVPLSLSLAVVVAYLNKINQAAIDKSKS